MKMIRLNNLDCIYKEGSGTKACVVLHGYGASCQDLAPLHSYLDPNGEYHWYFLDAPLSVDVGYGMQGRAWFPIDMMGLQQAIMTNSFKDFFSGVPSGFEEASEQVAALIKELEHGEIFLGGFSQGSMISANIAFSHPDLAKKVFLLSSTFVNRTKWEELLSNGISLPIYQSHGTNDPVLPISEAHALKDFLESKDQNHEYHEFSGGHEIPLPVIQSLSAFLAR